jgi:hypothetical protein
VRVSGWKKFQVLRRKHCVILGLALCDFLARLNLMLGRTLRAETELVHNTVFLLFQLPWCSVLDSKNVPPSAVWHGTFSRLYERLVLVQTTTMLPAIGPTCFVMDVEIDKSIPRFR